MNINPNNSSNNNYILSNEEASLSPVSQDLNNDITRKVHSVYTNHLQNVNNLAPQEISHAVKSNLKFNFERMFLNTLVEILEDHSNKNIFKRNYSHVLDDFQKILKEIDERNSVNLEMANDDDYFEYRVDHNLVNIFNNFDSEDLDIFYRSIVSLGDYSAVKHFSALFLQTKYNHLLDEERSFAHHLYAPFLSTYSSLFEEIDIERELENENENFIDYFLRSMHVIYELNKVYYKIDMISNTHASIYSQPENYPLEEAKKRAEQLSLDEVYFYAAEIIDMRNFKKFTPEFMYDNFYKKYMTLSEMDLEIE